MKNQIKFRVFNENCKSYVKNCDTNERFGVFTPLNTLVNSFSGDGLIFELSSNLKDKNDQEIFEGDILKIYDSFLDIYHYLIVKYTVYVYNSDIPLKNFGWLAGGRKSASVMKPRNRIYWHESLADINNNSYIVGNINEDYDLIKKYHE